MWKRWCDCKEVIVKILILGASGTVGSALYKCLSDQYDVYGTYNKNKPDDACTWNVYKYDIADFLVLESILNDVKPDLIISSLTGNFEHQLNVHRHIAEYLKESLGRCIFLSTANVFDGSPDSSHTEADTPYPISQYGKYKYSCEQLLLDYLDNRLLIVRLPRTLSSKDAIIEVQQVENGQPVYANLYKSYNTAVNVAKAIQFCIEANRYGIVHLTSNDIISASEFMELLLSHYEKNLTYAKDFFTTESYCHALGCDDPALVRNSDDGNFYLTLSSINTDLVTNFGISCKSIIHSL